MIEELCADDVKAAVNDEPTSKALATMLMVLQAPDTGSMKEWLIARDVLSKPTDGLVSVFAVTPAVATHLIVINEAISTSRKCDIFKKSCADVKDLLESEQTDSLRASNDGDAWRVHVVALRRKLLNAVQMVGVDVVNKFDDRFAARVLLTA